jgi:N-acetylneuraminate synthase
VDDVVKETQGQPPMHGTTYVIAEAGVNHNGSLELALRLIDTAAEAGADAVKFQTFRGTEVISRHAPKANYQKQTTGEGESQLAMVQKLELDADAHHRLVRHCVERGVQFLSTPFDVPSVGLLVSLGVPRLKIPSGEITNPVLLRAIAATGLPVIVSTGMSTLGEVESALGIIASAYVARNGGPVLTPAGALTSPEGRAILRDKVTLLHCTTEYPAPFGEVNLRAIETMRHAFGLPVGYSDHTPGIAIPTAAVALGACMIEKHFTLDCSLPGPDHRASLEPRELAEMVRAIRAVEQALGDGIKLPTRSEVPNLAVARRSLVAATAIRRGDRFTPSNLAVKRPGTGIPAAEYDTWLGRVAARDYESDELIER